MIRAGALVAAVAAVVLFQTSPVGAGDAGSSKPEPALLARADELRRLAEPFPRPPDRAPRVVFGGDSVAETLAPAFAAEAGRRGAQVVRSTRPGCGLLAGLPTTLDGFTPAWAEPCAREVSTWRGQIAGSGADVVVIVSTWDGSSRLLDGTLVDPATAEGRRTMVELNRQLVDDVAPRGSGRGVVFLAEAIPAPGATTGDASPTRISEARTHRAALRALAREEPDRVRVVDLGGWLCPTGPPCPPVVDGVTVRGDDGGHFTAAGAAWMAPRLADALGL